MRVDQGTTNVSSAGTAVQISNITNRVKFVQFKALAGNSGLAYVGVSDVSASLGYELSAGNTVELNFGEFGGSVPANIFYVDAATNNDKVCWLMIMEG
jgi:hypothetical protein|tara:strand:- start:766 stop:1059 length:294 start_codon:yes stop_codon:yes gene_type:complete